MSFWKRETANSQFLKRYEPPLGETWRRNALSYAKIEPKNIPKATHRPSILEDFGVFWRNISFCVGESIAIGIYCIFPKPLRILCGAAFKWFEGGIRILILTHLGYYGQN